MLQGPSHLATVDAASEGYKGRVLRRMRPLNWDSACDIKSNNLLTLCLTSKTLNCHAVLFISVWQRLGENVKGCILFSKSEELKHELISSVWSQWGTCIRPRDKPPFKNREILHALRLLLSLRFGFYSWCEHNSVQVCTRIRLISRTYGLFLFMSRSEKSKSKQQGSPRLHRWLNF